MRLKIIDILPGRLRHPMQGYDGYDGRETELGELFDEHGFWHKDTAPVDWGNPEAELDYEYSWRVFMIRALHGFSTVEISS